MIWQVDRQRTTRLDVLGTKENVYLSPENPNAYNRFSPSAMPSYPAFGFETTAQEVSATFSEEIKGKNVLITGTSLNGIGFETARVIAKYANLVVITGYNEERLALSEEAIKKETPTANVRRLILDLSSLEAVRKAAAEVNAYAEPIHVLINNAAAGLREFKLSVDNLEVQLATDYVGPFLFTNLLKGKLLAAASATYTPRVVFVSSIAHAVGTGVDLDFLKSPTENKYPPEMVYFQAKSANVSTALELSRRSKGAILGYSLHPGIIYTNINRGNEDVLPVLRRVGILDANGEPNTKDFQWKTIPQGAATTVAAAFDPRLVENPGAYLSDATVSNEMAAPHSTDPAITATLWAATEEIIGEKFEF
ncbi:Short-chain dehydrogenase/reductase family protein [Mycena indigotica]|uniref:Short-chain dehydrogenase/reductase family protein n=1 Tax=Mycena indigotica TaxID=2126181 RepID=A0A8H6VZH9_9AGAR|nr:Short-chain dehydrogenase/reductase family protein [Mycena indigotica]KAF7299462.1 Short-chain dehydrogenase/reductase family protein [Mycena indigotica]